MINQVLASNPWLVPTSDPVPYPHDHEVYDRFVAGIDRQIIKPLGRYLAESLKYVPWNEFKESLAGVISKLNNFLEELGVEDYAVLWDTGPYKSSRWIYEMGEQALASKPKAVSYMAIGEGIDNPMQLTLRRMYEDGIRVFVLMDDVMYRGKQMEEKVRTIRDALPHKDVRIVVAAPYVTRDAMKNVNGAGATKILFEEIMKPAYDEADEIERNRVRQTGFRLSDVLYYFPFKKGDVYSSPALINQFISGKIISPYANPNTPLGEEEIKEFKVFQAQQAADVRQVERERSAMLEAI